MEEVNIESSMRNVAFFAFILPIVISLFFGSFVMAEVLKEPDRSLNMWQFNFSEPGLVQSGGIKLTGLLTKYSVSQAIEIQVSINDSKFDCGDLYITIYDLNTKPKQVVTQSGYFDQCFSKNNSLLPLDDKFSETIDDVGQYEIVIEMNDQAYKNSVTASKMFTVN